MRLKKNPFLQGSLKSQNRRTELTEDRYNEILAAFLGAPDLLARVNVAPTFEAGYELVAEKMPGLSLEEFTEAMNMLRQVMLANAGNTSVQ